MMRSIVSALAMLVFTSMGYSQNSFQFTYGDALNDEGHSILITSDKGFVMGGTYGDTYIYLLKTDSIGNQIWNKTYETPTSWYFDWSYSVKQTSNNGYIICGNIGHANGSGYDVCLIATDSVGDSLWTKIYTGPNDHFIAYDMIVTADNGYAIVGFEESGDKDVFVVKTDSLGNVMWAKSYGGSNDEEGLAIIEESNGDLVISGHTFSYGKGIMDVYLLKVDQLGSLIWTKTHGADRSDYCTDLIALDDGYVLTGRTSGFGTGAIYDDDLYLMRTDLNGNMVWANTYGDDQNDGGKSLIISEDSNIVVTGYTSSSGAGQTDVYLIKADLGGNHVWSHTFGGTLSEEGSDLVELSNGGYAIVGETRNFGKGQNDLYLIRVDSIGMGTCQQDSAVTIVTPLTWLSDTGGVESSGFKYTYEELIPSEADTNIGDPCFCVPPTANFSASMTHACGSFYDNSTWTDSWLWVFGDGDTSTQQSPGHCFWGSGNFNVCLTVSNACGTDTFCQTIGAWIGIAEYDTDPTPFRLIPNPMINTAEVRIEGVASASYGIKVFDALGRLVGELNNVSSGAIIERKSLTGGVYYVQLYKGEVPLGARKLIIE